MVDCPCCGTSCVERRRSSCVTVLECPSCEPEPLWRQGVRGLAGLVAGLPRLVFVGVARRLYRIVR